MYFALIKGTNIIYAQGANITKLRKAMKKTARSIGDKLYQIPYSGYWEDEIAFSEIADAWIICAEMSLETIQESDWSFAEWVF